jgi:zinc transport system ATP-binding protein
VSEAAIEFEGVTYRYPGAAAPAVEGVSLRVERGSTLAIVGPNGAGKTTLLRLALGLIRGHSGTVRVCGVPATEARRRRLVGTVGQRSELESWLPLTGREVVSMAAGLARRATPARERVERAIERVGAGAYADRVVGGLSGGELQRVLIARALAVEPQILALDEPTVGIDAAGQHRFGELLSELNRSSGGDGDLTIVLVSHDLRAVASGWASCDRVACVRRTVHFHDAPGGVTPQVLAEVFEHDLAPVFGEMHVDAHRAADCDHDHGHPHTHHDGGGGGAP